MADQNSSSDIVVKWAEKQNWIRPELEQTAQSAIQSVFEVMGDQGHTVRSFLQGDWLHEPLHVPLTDIPVGAWSATVVLDALAAVSGRTELDAGADVTLYLGLLGAVGAAVTGMTDWSTVDDPKTRRVGAVHALVNIAATTLFGVSALVRRKPETRGNGRALAAIGYVLVGLSAHLGGNMVYERGMGVRPLSQSEPQSAETDVLQ